MTEFVEFVFPQEEKFREVNEALRLAQIQWIRRGPPNKRWVKKSSQRSMQYYINTAVNLVVTS